MLKNQNQNEKYLLKFISNPYTNTSENELLKLLVKLGCNLKFKNYNPVYQIIDELTYSKYLSHKG